MAVLVALMMLVVFVACDDPADTTTPDTTNVPETTEPDETLPDETEPDETLPDETEPDETEPDETLPDETEPDETLPAETEPAETEPAETEPAETEPATPQQPGVHTHDYAVSEVSPTCTTPGVLTYACSCGEFYEEAGADAVGHFFSLYETIPANCTTTGEIIYKCDTCGVIESEMIPVGHYYGQSILLVSAENDPRGVGYELLKCTGCKEAQLVSANDPSGHNLGADGKCLCGTSIVYEDLTLATNDFSAAQGEIFLNNNIDFVVADGAWDVAAQGLCTIENDENVDFAQLLKGVYDGKAVTSVELSFDLKYTGTGAKKWSWWTMYFGSEYHNSFNFDVDATTGILKTYDCSNPVTLNPNETHKFNIVFDVKGGTSVQSFVNGKLQKGKGVTMSNFSYMSIDLSLLAESGVTIDNMTITYKATTSDESAKNSDYSCAHTTITEASSQNAAYPAAENWNLYTCEDCKVYWYAKGCETHVWSDTPVEGKTVDSTCSVAGKEYYACAAFGCSAEEARELKLLDHTPATFVAIVPATGDAAGYETWNCEICLQNYDVEGNHDAGHNFDAEGNCLCGATYANKVLAKNDFSSENQIVITPLGAGDTVVTENGVWKASTSAGMYAIYASDNPEFLDLLDGEFNGETVTSVIFSFKLTGYDDYIGVTSSTPANAWEWWQTYFGTTTYQRSFNLASKAESAPNGGIAIYDSSNVFELTKDEPHEFKIVIDVRTGSVASYVDDKLQVTNSYTLTDFCFMTINNSKLGGATLYIDDMAINYISNSVDTSNMQTPAQ